MVEKADSSNGQDQITLVASNGTRFVVESAGKYQLHYPPVEPYDFGTRPLDGEFEPDRTIFEAGMMPIGEVFASFPDLRQRFLDLIPRVELPPPVYDLNSAHRMIGVLEEVVQLGPGDPPGRLTTEDARILATLYLGFGFVIDEPELAGRFAAVVNLGPGLALEELTSS